MPKKKDPTSSGDLTQKAYNGIRQMMFHNEMVSGQKIPFKELAEQMVMSVTPVIQALKFLEFQGLVRHEPNKGYFIQSLSLGEIKELFDFRLLLETSMLEKTIASLDEQGEQALKECHQDYLNALEGMFMSKKLVADMNFHLKIAELSGQTLQMRSLKNVFDILHLRYQISLRYVTSSQSNERDHGEILDAILARDLDTARDLLVRHISSSGQHSYDNVGRMIEEKAEFQY